MILSYLEYTELNILPIPALLLMMNRAANKSSQSTGKIVINRQG